ncbi:deleted in malignant brain tumors 1 protein-like [Mercenaria mercenaria]|uniref:deleted in malignant brain tumors 1 protein-like n=1 Tax=Mercenaria mercenaria TaxID=6596 RepID=UPI00234E3B6E|nr:deleted in malignant brain tumors 1 protein-like [Mercenaria mercenaria]
MTGFLKYFSLCVVLFVTQVSGIQFTFSRGKVVTGSNGTLTMRCDVTENDVVTIYLIQMRRETTPGSNIFETLVQMEKGDAASETPTLSETINNNKDFVAGGSFDETTPSNTYLLVSMNISKLVCNDARAYMCDLIYKRTTGSVLSVEKNGTFSAYAYPHMTQLEGKRNGFIVQGSSSSDQAAFDVGDELELTCTANIGSLPATTIRWRKTSEKGTMDDFIEYHPPAGTFDQGTAISDNQCSYTRIASITYNTTAADANRDNNLAFECYVSVSGNPYGTTYTTQNNPRFYADISGDAQANRDYSLKGAIQVVCTNYHWYITVDMNKIRHVYPTAKASDIYLGENKCKGVENGDILIFQQDLSECLTSELLVDGIEVYNNELIYAEHDPVYLFIVLHYNWTVGVECDIGQNGTAIGGFPSNATSTIAHNVSSPQYPVSVSFYKDQDFIHEIGKGNPLHAEIGSHVYVKVFTTATDWNIRMRVHTCYTKPTEHAHDHMKYFLIKDGCEVNTNTHIISQSTHATRFVFDSFEYSNSHEGIYMFCDALFCDSSDWSAQCRQTCNPVT